MTADGSDAPLGAPRFDVVLRGYDRRQVDEHVARLQRVLARMRRDLDFARNMPQPVLTPAGVRPSPTPRYRPEGRLEALLENRSEGPDVVGSFTDRMQAILNAAEEEAAEIRDRARAVRRAEEEKAAGLRRSLIDLARQRDAVLAELTRLRGQLDGLLAAPTTRVVLPVQGNAASMSSAEVHVRDAGAGQPLPGTPPGPGGAVGGEPDGPWPEAEPAAERTAVLAPARERAEDDAEPADEHGPGTALLPAAERPDAAPEDDAPDTHDSTASASVSSRSG
jgi:syndecan 1